MYSLPAARLSPRVENGILKWYESDTFTLEIELEISDHEGNPVTFSQNDRVTVVFMNNRRSVVKEFSCVPNEENTISMKFDETITKLFTKGEYSYDVILTSEYRSTLVNNNRVVVER